MAETAAKPNLDFLKTKLGPFPLIVWLGAGLALMLYLQHRNKSVAGQGTDPAGNTGQINPQTGYVYGSPEDKAAQASNAGTTTETSSSASTVAGKYVDNNAWARAAINYLVGIGIDPSQANEAIQQYLSSQQTTTAQQADVNEAIQALGPPPDLPGPVGTAPGPVVTPPPGPKPPPPPPPGGKPPPTYASNPPHGFTVTRRTKTSISLKWNKVAHATGYTVRYAQHKGGPYHTATTSASKTSVTIGNLKPNNAYYFEVWADPRKAGAPYAGAILGHTAK